MSDAPVATPPVEPEPEVEPPVLTELEQLELLHGFTFGGADAGAGADAVATLVCTNPKCGNKNQHLAIHADTALPVYCGSCSAVLHCEHNMVESLTHEGTYGAPVEVRSQKCTMCYFTAEVTKRALPAVDLSTIPLGAPVG